MPFLNREYDLDQLTGDITVAEKETISFSLSDFPEEIVQRAALYGLSKKMVDSVAGEKARIAKDRGVDTRDISDSDAEYISAMVSGIKDTLEQLKSGEWTAARGEGEAKPRVTELAEAIARVKGMPISDAVILVRKVGEEDKEKLSRWRKHPQIQLAIAQIRKEKAAARLEAALKRESIEEFDTV